MTNGVKSSKEKQKYKYRIHDLLNQLPHNQYKMVLKFLPKKLGVSPETFRKWRYIKKTDRATVPADHLALIAKFFKISLDKMFNYEIKQITFESLKKEHWSKK